MKKLSFILFIACCLLFFAVNAQTKFPPLDKSPMDMSTYPNNYAVLKMQGKITERLVARVIYSRPQKSDREIFGNLVAYGRVWRLGANEATELEFYKNVKIKNVKIKKGRYTMYCIPYEDKWTVIINSELDTWGSFKYNEKNDVVRIDIPVQKQTEINDSFVMVFEKTITGANLLMAWDNVKISLPISF